MIPQQRLAEDLQLLREKASQYALYGVIIASASVVVATLLVSYVMVDAIALEGNGVDHDIAHQQCRNNHTGAGDDDAIQRILGGFLSKKLEIFCQSLLRDHDFLSTLHRRENAIL